MTDFTIAMQHGIHRVAVAAIEPGNPIQPSFAKSKAGEYRS